MRDVQDLMVRAAVAAGMPKTTAEHIASGALHFLRKNVLGATAHYPAVGRAMLAALEQAAGVASEVGVADTLPPEHLALLPGGRS